MKFQIPRYKGFKVGIFQISSIQTARKGETVRSRSTFFAIACAASLKVILCSTILGQLFLSKVIHTEVAV